MAVTRKDIHSKAEALNRALRRFTDAASDLRAGLSEAERQRQQGNYGQAEFTQAKAEARFSERTEGMNETISKARNELNATLDTWKAQADAGDPLISQAVGIIGATGKDTPRELVGAMVSSARQPFQAKYLQTLFDAKGMTEAAMAARDRYAAMAPDGIGADLGTAVYISAKHGGLDGSTSRAIADAIGRTDAMCETFADAGEGGAE